MTTKNVATRNITPALPEKTLRELEIIAAKRGTSVSALLRDKLEVLVLEESDYERARREFAKTVDKGFQLGTHGEISGSRDELHER